MVTWWVYLCIVRLWDTRAVGQAATIIRQEDEVLSCALGLGGFLVATAIGEDVRFFDLRRPQSPLGVYSSCHTDIVTRVRFHPTRPTTLVSGAEDGLLCIYDTGVTREDEALQNIINAESTVRGFSFFGKDQDGLAIWTGTEGLSLWHAPSAFRIADHHEARELINRQLDRGLVTYLIGCYYEETGDRLVLTAGDIDGVVTLSLVRPDVIRPSLQLQGGHGAVVRCLEQYTADVIITGGEDARLCSWRIAGQTQAQGCQEPAGAKRRKLH